MWILHSTWFKQIGMNWWTPILCWSHEVVQKWHGAKKQNLWSVAGIYFPSGWVMVWGCCLRGCNGLHLSSFFLWHQGPETRPLFGYFGFTTFIVHQEAWWNLWESMGSSMVLSACKKRVVWPINCTHIERLLANLHVSLCNHVLSFLDMS